MAASVAENSLPTELPLRFACEIPLDQKQTQERATSDKQSVMDPSEKTSTGTAEDEVEASAGQLSQTPAEQGDDQEAGEQASKSDQDIPLNTVSTPTKKKKKSKKSKSQRGRVSEFQS